MENKRTNHPAQGVVVLTKRSGKHALYGSDNYHYETIALSFHESEHEQGTTHEYFAQTKPILELEMSAHQWAMMVSSFGNGGGTPCTYLYRADIPGDIPTYTLPPERTETLKASLNSEIQRGLETLHSAEKNLTRILSEKGPSKKSDLEDIKSQLRQAYNALGPNVDHFNTVFSKNIEKKTSEAKIEVEAYINNRVRDAGLEALGAKPVKTKTLT